MVLWPIILNAVLLGSIGVSELHPFNLAFPHWRS